MPRTHRWGHSTRCCTIVSRAPGGHKAVRALLAALTLLGAANGAARAQAVEPGASAGQVASVAAGAAAYLVPSILGIPNGSPPCAPCDPATVPAFDRWAIRRVRDGVARTSDALLLGLAALTLVDLAGGEGGDRRVLVAVEAATWTAASTSFLKALIHRSRPVLYTADAPDAAREPSSRRSMPSGHTSMAVALGVSYLLARTDPPAALRVAVPILGVGVGSLRVAAGRHFPTDVVVGAALGAVVAWGVHEIRY